MSEFDKRILFATIREENLGYIQKIEDNLRNHKEAIHEVRLSQAEFYSFMRKIENRIMIAYLGNVVTALTIAYYLGEKLGWW